MAQMAGAKVKTGTITGKGSATISIDVGFEPDIIVIASGLDYTSSNLGMLNVVLVRGIVMYNTWRTSSAYGSTGNNVSPNGDVWGAKESYGNYASYATYSNGVLTISNQATTTGRCYFIDGHTYTWTAYKA